MVYNKYAYIDKIKRIRSLETELVKLKGQLGIVPKILEKECYNISLYEHYVTVWKRDNVIRIKVNVCSTFKKMYTKDNYGWELIFCYTQMSLFPLDFRYFYYLDKK